MAKRILLLNGLAILVVVCNHSAWWGIIAMFWWTDQYRSVTVPNYDQHGTLAYYALMLIVRIAFFAVPAFLFVSGFFVTYASRGTQTTSTWKMVRARIVNLLIPYLIWSVVCFVGDAVQGITFAPGEYLRRLALGEADTPYFFVPILCQFYLISPLLIPLAKTHGRRLLAVAACLQLTVTSLRYLAAFLARPSAAIDLLIGLTPVWSFMPWAFFFTLGLVAGFHLGHLTRWLARFRWPILFATVAMFILTMLEAEIVARATGEQWESALKLSSSLYAIGFILCFMQFGKILDPWSKRLFYIGRRSFGIYLTHNKVLDFSARAIRQITPWMLAYQATLLTPTLIAAGLGIPLLAMAAVAKSPARRLYRHLFG